MGTLRSGFERRLADAIYEQAVEKVTAALKSDGGVGVSSADPRAMSTMDNPAVDLGAAEAEERLRRVSDAVDGKEGV